MEHMDPYETAEAVCPNPTDDQFAVLVGEVLIDAAALVRRNPTLSRNDAINSSIEAFCEGWELSAHSEARLREHFEVALS